MCEAMGRDIVSVIFGGAGTAVVAPAEGAVEIEGEVTTSSVDALSEALLEAKSIMISPGYGLCVAVSFIQYTYEP